MNPITIAIEHELREHVARRIGELSSQEQAIIRLRFGFVANKTHTLAEIGKVFNLTRERIRQLEKKALHALASPQMKEMLDGLEETRAEPARVDEGILDIYPLTKCLPKEVRARLQYIRNNARNTERLWAYQESKRFRHGRQWRVRDWNYDEDAQQRAIERRKYTLKIKAGEKKGVSRGSKNVRDDT